MEHTFFGLTVGARRRNWTEVVRAGVRTNSTRRFAALFLAAGIIFAIATDGELSQTWSRTLFGLLFVANVIVADWLIDDRRIELD